MDADGLLVIDTPAGWTSHDVVKRVKRLVGAHKVGHTGTLDPAATGVLVLCLNKATRWAAAICDQDKAYEARIRLGESTDTGDRDGQTLERADVPVLTQEMLDRVLKRFQGDIEQVVPAYSAVRVGGKRLYQLARQGRILNNRPRRRVTLHEIDLLSWTEKTLDIFVTCSKGTYIRVLAEEIGKSLQVPAHLEALRRVRVGPFGLEQAITLEQLEETLRQGDLGAHHLFTKDGAYVRNFDKSSQGDV